MSIIPGASAVRWLDFHFDRESPWLDGERTALDFLEIEHPARTTWTWLWPHGGTPITWDAVAKVKVNGSVEWLLVEAKAHLSELNSSCGAKEDWGRPLVRETLDRVKEALGADQSRDWMDGCYQFCNRLAVIHHLVTHDAPAHMLWIYFTGDRLTGRRVCPANEHGWREALGEQAKKVGLPADHPLASRLHSVFLPVCPNT
jgi:hypothetical protein